MCSNLAATVRKNKIPILLVVLLFVGAAVAVGIYLSLEKAFYVWDNVNYYNLSVDFYRQLTNSFSDGLKNLLDSLNNDYNIYYAIPILPFYFIGGTSRLVYEIALIVVYMVPFILVIGLIGRRLLDNGKSSGRVFWLVVGVELLLPTVWLPTLRAYPDTAAALATALATLLYLKDTSLKRLGRVLAIGVLIGLAALLRRHFIYDIPAFFGAAGIVTLVKFAGEVRQGEKTGRAVRQFITRVFQLVVAGILALLTLFFLNPQVVVKILVVDFNKLYASYTVPWNQELGWLLDSFGWLPFGLALVGLGWLWRKTERKDEILFFGLFGIFELLVWVVYVRQSSIQYTLHLTVFVVVGLTAFLLYGWQFLKSRTKPMLYRAGTGLGAAFIVANLVAGLVLPSGTVAANLFSTNWQPLIRADYQRVIDLAAYLDQQTTPNDPIYIVASSYRFNIDTFTAAMQHVTGQTTPGLNLIHSPDIDSRDEYPLGLLLNASLVVVIDPFEHHIAPEQQEVVKVVYDMFLQNKGLAQDFAVLNPNFTIDAATRAVVFKRSKVTSVQSALATLQMIQSYVAGRPGVQHDWINLDLQKPVGVSVNGSGETEFGIDRSQWTNPVAATSGQIVTDPGKAELVYTWPVTGQEKFQGNVTFGSDNCGEATLDFLAATLSQAPTQFAEFEAKPGQGQTFSLDFSKVKAGQFVLLNVTPPTQDGCTFTVDLDSAK